MTPAGVTSLTAAALMLDLDTRTAEVTRRLSEHGIRSILLKGPAIAKWLYNDGSTRLYRDSDLLVAPDQIAAAEHLLIGWGYRHPPLDDLVGDRPWHAHFWTNGVHSIDLHRTLIGAGIPPQRVWDYLAARTDRMRIGGEQLEVLATPPRLAHVALHAAQDGVRLGRPLEDLERAVEQLGLDDWTRACEVAFELGAAPAFSAGLRLVPAGSAIAERLALPHVTDSEVLLRAQGGPTLSLGFDWLWRIPGAAAKSRFLRSKLLPPADFMRAWTPLARHGLVGLVLSYPWRVIWLILKAPRGFIEWMRTRRST